MKSIINKTDINENTHAAIMHVLMIHARAYNAAAQLDNEQINDIIREKVETLISFVNEYAAED
jgi:hypothetical protein